MRKANRRNGNGTITRRLAEVRMNEHERQRAAHAIRDAEAIVEAMFWVRDRIAMIRTSFLKPVLKH